MRYACVMNRRLSYLGALLALAGGAHGADRIAFVTPRATFQTQSGQVQGGNGTVSIEEVVGRIFPKLVNEREKLGWSGLEIVPWDLAKAAYSAESATAPDSPAGRVRILDAVARKLGARYVVSSEVRELTSYRASSFPLPRRGGRATVALTVYDAESKKFVYDETKTATSVRAQVFDTESLRQVQDQALFNAYRQALDPFAKNGVREELATASLKLVGTVRSVSGGKVALLDLGDSSGVQVGDVFESLDGAVVLKITEVLSNGALAEVVSGRPEKDMAVRTKG